jgi:hypothetical protein
VRDSPQLEKSGSGTGVQMEEKTTQRPKSRAWLWFLLGLILVTGVLFLLENDEAESVASDNEDAAVLSE